MAELGNRGRTLRRAAGVAILALALGGCALKGGQNVSLVEGKTLFIKNCAQCHTLARAHTTGIVGPNLDDAFVESLQVGEGRKVIEGIVEQQVEYPSTAGRMPKLPLSTLQAADISNYVAYAAARPGQDSGLLANVGSTKVAPAAVEKDGKLAFFANPAGLLAYTVKQATATAGPITISMTNKSGVPHNLAIQAGAAGPTLGSTPVLGHTPISPSGTHSFTVNLKPGVYTFYCEVPGHREAGMYGTLTVK